MSTSAGTARQLVAAIIALAAMSIFVDFRVGTKFGRYSKEHGQWSKIERQFLKEHGETPIRAIERLNQENKLFRAIIVRHKLDLPEEKLDNPQGSATD